MKNISINYLIANNVNLQNFLGAFGAEDAKILLDSYKIIIKKRTQDWAFKNSNPIFDNIQDLFLFIGDNPETLDENDFFAKKEINMLELAADEISRNRILRIQNKAKDIVENIALQLPENKISFESKVKSLIQKMEKHKIKPEIAYAKNPGKLNIMLFPEKAFI